MSVVDLETQFAADYPTFMVEILNDNARGRPYVVVVQGSKNPGVPTARRSSLAAREDAPLT